MTTLREYGTYGRIFGICEAGLIYEYDAIGRTIIGKFDGEKVEPQEFFSTTYAVIKYGDELHSALGWGTSGRMAYARNGSIYVDGEKVAYYDGDVGEALAIAALTIIRKGLISNNTDSSESNVSSYSGGGYGYYGGHYSKSKPSEEMSPGCANALGIILFLIIGVLSFFFGDGVTESFDEKGYKVVVYISCAILLVVGVCFSELGLVSQFGSYVFSILISFYIGGIIGIIYTLIFETTDGFFAEVFFGILGCLLVPLALAFSYFIKVIPIFLIGMIIGKIFFKKKTDEKK